MNSVSSLILSWSSTVIRKVASMRWPPTTASPTSARVVPSPMAVWYLRSFSLSYTTSKSARASAWPVNATRSVSGEWITTS